MCEALRVSSTIVQVERNGLSPGHTVDDDDDDEVDDEYHDDDDDDDDDDEREREREIYIYKPCITHNKESQEYTTIPIV